MEDDKRRIMVVDDDITNLNACVFSLMEFYDIIPASSADKMFKLLAKVKPELIILDIEMPEKDGFEAMRELKRNGDLANIPVIFMTATMDPEWETNGVELGALDFIYKPLSRALTLRRLKNYFELIDFRSQAKGK
ncbi:MAG: response regulator [Deltaproteobacteria bacterium]|jgi:response regulator RpfG family c-di-GMP phosphodiesterase|nr:response regulator [Deltaproteobacteria bacterium]